jgi:hypothetical protein
MLEAMRLARGGISRGGSSMRTDPAGSHAGLYAVVWEVVEVYGHDAPSGKNAVVRIVR